MGPLPNSLLVGKRGPEGGATGGDRGTRMLCVLPTEARPLPFTDTFFGGGEGLPGAIPGGFGAKLGFPWFITGGLLGRVGGLALPTRWLWLPDTLSPSGLEPPVKTESDVLVDIVGF